MEEKKKVNKLSYSRAGKMFRGFLCMVTFFAFAAGLVLSIYSVDTYGRSIITNPKAEYRNTTAFANEVQSEIMTVLANVQTAAQADKVKKVITIIDADKKKSYDIDLTKLNNEEVTSLEQCLREYRINTKMMKYLEIADYISLGAYLRTDHLQNDFLYLSADAFISLFEANGYRNTGYRFSTDYSEEACFVFDFQGSYLKGELMNDPLGTDVVINVSVNGKQVTVDDEADDNQESVKSSRYDLDGEQYAVYEPETDTFFSVWDDFFGPMESYLYRVGELNAYISASDKTGYRYDSIIIPMLKCYNYPFQEFADEALDDYNSMLAAKDFLEQCENQGIYYLFTDGHKTYSNVEDSSHISRQEYCYQLKKTADREYELLNGDGTPLEEEDALCGWDLNSNELLKEWMKSYPTGTVWFFAFNPALDNRDSVKQHLEQYPFFRHTRLFVLTAGIAFLLLVVQAVWLIRTTGRESKDASQVHLNWFDRVDTEIWFAGSIALLGVWPILGYGIVSGYMIDTGNRLARCAMGVADLVPFAFCFMLLTLSFARRIKARNLWNGSLLYKIVNRFRLHKWEKPKWIARLKPKKVNSPAAKCWRLVTGWITRCRTFYQELSGTTKFMICFVMYITSSTLIMYIACIFLFSDPDVQIGLCIVLIYLLLQALMINTVRRIIKDTKRLMDGVKEITKGNLDYKITINRHDEFYWELADGINHINDGLKAAVETSIKDERMKTELITNVSHDLKTPLTSIINYINLLKTEKMPTPEAEHYIEVLDAKALRLKQLTDDLVEAAKATSGSIELEMVPLAFDELMKQALGEFEDKFAARSLTVIAHYPKEPAVVMADGRRIFRVLENILQNAYKYALEGTRIYADLSNNRGEIAFTLKNVSAAVLDISPDELMERFTRGDSSRTTEGSGLGLSIAKDLTRLQNGNLEIILDGDLFKVIVTFPEFVRDDSERDT